MPKNSFFTGQPVFSQLLSLLPADIISDAVRKFNGDRYCKTFKTYDHLVAMLYACFHRCTSLREVVIGMQANHNKLGQLGLSHMPRRSTLSEANKRRPADIFGQLYHQLYRKYYRLPDSPKPQKLEERLFIMDSTTISLFTDIMKAAGCPAADGRRKGGAKAHVLLDAHNDIPSLVRISESSRNDRIFMSHIELPKGSILVFDKGYHKFSQWQQWTDEKINWVTRLIDNEIIEVVEDRQVHPSHSAKGVLADQHIILGRGTNKPRMRISVRLVTYFDKETQKVFQFLTNNFRFSPVTVADIYAGRWQIELFFKRFKKHNPLRLFLGNNENAIKVQIWSSLIAELLLKIIKDQVSKPWSFANLSAIIRHNLMNYLYLKTFLNDPDRLQSTTKNKQGLSLFT